MRRIFAVWGVLPVLAVAFLLPGCMATTAVNVLDTYAAKIFRDENTNLTTKNYAAADYLIQQAHTFIDGNDLIKVVPLQDVETPEMTAQIGRVIPEQIGVRLSQIGYGVDLAEVTSGPESNYLKPSATQQKRQPDFILTGTYQRKGQDLNIHLRIVDSGNARVVGAFDYILPMDHDIAEMAEPETRIFKTP